MAFGTFELWKVETLKALRTHSLAAAPTPLMRLANREICFENMHNYECMKRTRYYGLVVRK